MRRTPRSISRFLPALAALSIAACTGRGHSNIPPADQLVPISQPLKERVRAHEAALEQGGFAKTRDAIDRTLADIAHEHGGKSIEVPQSLTETGVMIIEAGKAADAEPYMRRAMDANIEVYGAEHRETAFAVGDYGQTLLRANPKKFVPAATPLFATGEIDWSADGRAVLLYLVGYPDGKFMREFYRFDAKAGKFRKIDGLSHENFHHGEEYIDRGHVVATYLPAAPNTRAWYGELRSASGVWRAHIDDAHRLLISNAAGADTLVELGGYNDCEGVTIGITGWVDDRYLVYRNESRHIIYEPATKRRALLLGQHDASGSYTW